MENVFISKLEIKWEDEEVKEEEGKKKEEKLITKQKSEMKVFLI